MMKSYRNKDYGISLTEIDVLVSEISQQIACGSAHRLSSYASLVQLEEQQNFDITSALISISAQMQKTLQTICIVC